MATKKQAMQIIAELDGLVDWTVSEITAADKTITIDAPKGKIWNASGCSIICEGWMSGSASDFWDLIICEVNCGLDDAA